MNTAEATDDAVPSPCISVCTMNAATGLCDGCLRTLDEIACWSLFDPAEKRTVLARIADRRSQTEPARAPA
jgi:predicted Fe-S protein YdhL (DUF1289 family)